MMITVSLHCYRTALIPDPSPSLHVSLLLISFLLSSQSLFAHFSFLPYELIPISLFPAF